ncbi:MAG: LPS-assembly protein LptD [Candidatus Rokuibacteriota bacterium]
MTARTLLVILLVGLAVLAGPRPTLGQTTITVPSAEGQVTVVADRIEQFGPDNLVVATGNVEITRGNARLLADRAEVNRETGDVAAVGRVIFYDGDDQLAGDRIDYNYKTGTGVVINGRSRTAPYYRLSGERMERLGEGLYGIRRGVFTTCEDDPPTWSFQADTATADLNDAVYGTHASFWVKEIPIIPWLPGFYAAIRRERQTGFLFPVAGYSGFKGFFAEIPFFWAISDSQDALISLGVMTDRGVAANATYRYVLSPRNQGALTGFLVYESEVEGDVRGYYSFKHGWNITPRLSLTADVNGVSDNSFLRDYAVPLQTRGAQFVPSNVFLSQRWPTFNLTGNVFWYQDLTQRSPVALQRLPQLFFNGAPQPIPGLPGFLYQFDTSAVNFVREVGSEGGRVAVQPLVSRPTRIANAITVTPFAGAIVTGYTKTVTGQSPGPGQGIVVEDTNNDALLRGLAILGGDIEARASRIYRAGFMGIDALMHVVEPRFNYTFIDGRGLEGVPQWTELDRIDKSSRFAYSLINRVFARTAAPEGTEALKLEVMRLTVAQSYDLLRTANPFSSLFGELIVNPSSFLYFRGDATYDVYGAGLQSATTNLGLVLTPELATSSGATALSIGAAAASIGTTYDKNAKVNFVQGAATADITRFVTARFQTNWSIESGTFVENRYGLDIKFQCWALALEYITRFQSSNEFRFTLNLLGVGGFGSGFGFGTSGSGSGLF